MSPETNLQTNPVANPEEFDIVILGGGTGGTVAAWTFAAEGRRVALIERKYVGGSCPNIACLPSKNVIHSAKVASYFTRGREFGIVGMNGGFTTDMRAVRERKRKMVSSWNDVYLENYKATGAEFILGDGRFIAPKTIEVELPDGTKRQLRAENVIVNTGTHATLEPIPGLVEAQPLTHIEALELDEVPAHLIVLGSGYIGLEFAQAMRRFGSNVTVIGRNPRFLPTEDEDVSDAVHRLFADEHIDVVLDAKVTQVSGKSGESDRRSLRKKLQRWSEKQSRAPTSSSPPAAPPTRKESASTSRASNSPQTDTSKRTSTSPRPLPASGPSAKSPAARCSRTSASTTSASSTPSLTGGNRVTTGRQVPFCLFIDPELARYGLSEKEAQAQNIPYRLFKIPMEAVMRATHHGRNARLPESARRAQKPIEILGFTVFGVRRSRSHGLRPDRNVRRNALHRSPRHNLDAPNPGRRLEPTLHLNSETPPRAREPSRFGIARSPRSRKICVDSPSLPIALGKFCRCFLSLLGVILLKNVAITHLAPPPPLALRMHSRLARNSALMFRRHRVDSNSNDGCDDNSQ